jgi:hypothetical protein
MTAAAQDIDTTKYSPLAEQYPYKAKDATQFYRGILVNSDAGGFLVQAADVANHKCVGVSVEKKLSAGGDGATLVLVEDGVWEFTTGGASALVQADVGRLAYVLDNQTVVKAAGTTNNVVAGKVVRIVSATKVLIDTRIKSV